MRVHLMAFGAWSVLAIPAFGATTVATYCFDNTFDDTLQVAPALIEIDPLDASGFVNDTVFGQMRTVWSFDGNNIPIEEQAGLTLETEGLISPTIYSVDMVLLFTEREDEWRSIIHVGNRMTDTGFYVRQGNNVLQVYNVQEGVTAWTNNEYHHVALTNDGTTVSAYLDGEFEFAVATGLMDLDNVNNPELLMNFIIDNNLGGNAPEEYSDGKLALIRMWDGPLTASEVEILAGNPFIVPGDYNGDYYVDAADYVVWRKFVGTTYPLLSDLIGGEIGEPHYQQWRKYFGEMGCPPLSGGMSGIVPEPTAGAAIAVCLVSASIVAPRKYRRYLTTSKMLL